MKKITTYALFAGLSLGFGNLSAQEVSVTALGNTTLSVMADSNTTNPPAADAVIWEQERIPGNTEYSAVSSYFDLANWGMYLADDFEFTGETKITKMVFDGTNSNSNPADVINHIDIYFFLDNNGQPGSHPESTNGVFKTISGVAYNSPHLTVDDNVNNAFLGNRQYTLNVADFLGEDLIFPAGKYWISIVFNISASENSTSSRWSWIQSPTTNLNDAVVISPQDPDNMGLTNWTSITEAGLPIEALSFTFYGESEDLLVNNLDKNAFAVYPIPSSTILNLETPNNTSITKVSAFDITGKQIQLKLENNTINIEQLPVGLYILEINSTEGTHYKKFIKK
ncbi:hypothetical protein GGR32_001424 [Mesonia hippocampi]|uniref:Secretion system C-terminal sorting domain-containing protein n=1 Tax=Mesonia hippocampi TaxID=1628250 RepID=A0A840ELY1_9FLAO|nr:T9SS type A sorting domain-containing protein [Mesonia hippocampi]MBB4119128.1 hypothetical protein [Mesonia hippocampi]